MNGIAAEIAVEIHMFFEQHDRHAFARQQQSQHCSGGSSTRYTTGCFIHVCRLFGLCSFLILHNSPLFSLCYAICLRIVAALKSTITTANSSSAPSCPTMPMKSAPLSITPRKASLA